jgi:NADPH:quinone reductase-like Zn-dependent oxidoreductase
LVPGQAYVQPLATRLCQKEISMRAMVVRRYGPPKVFESQEVPDPQPKEGEVLIRVKAIGLNFADLLQRMGIYPGTPKPPFVPGVEIAGVVDRVAGGGKPAEGEPLKVGDAVCALTQFNAYAEWAVVPARQVFRLPPGIPFEDAAAIPVNYLTAYHSMFAMGNLQPGDRILVHGAGGGVGIAAVQLARARGLVTFGTAGPTKQEYLRKIGVDHPIDYAKSDFVEIVRKYAPDGIEMVMDPIGGKSFARSQSCLGPTGRLVVYGFSAAVGPEGRRSLPRALIALMQTPRFHPLKLMRQSVSIIGVNLGRMQTRGALLRSELDELFRMYTAGKIKPVIGKTFKLAEAAASHEFIHDRKNIGKVILAVK